MAINCLRGGKANKNDNIIACFEWASYFQNVFESK